MTCYNSEGLDGGCNKGVSSEGSCYISSTSGSLKEAISYCTRRDSQLLSAAAPDWVKSVPVQYRFDNMWLAATSLAWVWNNKGV